MQNGFLALNLDGVPSVVAALKANNNAALGAQHIYNLALALVAPLGSDDDRIRHGVTCLQYRRATAGDVGCVYAPDATERPKGYLPYGPTATKAGRKAFDGTYPVCKRKSNGTAGPFDAQVVSFWVRARRRGPARPVGTA